MFEPKVSPKSDFSVKPSEADAQENSGRIKARVEGWVMTSDIFARLAGRMPDGIVSPLIAHVLNERQEADRPLVASVNIINKCNLHCAGCYWGQTERQQEKQEVLSFDEGDILLRDLWGKGVRQFLFLGGGNHL